MVAVLRSRSWQVRKCAQQMVKKLLSVLGGSGLAHGLLGELCMVVNKHTVSRSCRGGDLRRRWFSHLAFQPNLLLCLTVCPLAPLQLLPQDALVSETGELTELGRAYTPPRALVEALHVICSCVGQWGDQGEAEKMAIAVIKVTHHPSIGTARRHSNETNARWQ